MNPDKESLPDPLEAKIISAVDRCFDVLKNRLLPLLSGDYNIDNLQQIYDELPDDFPYKDSLASAMNVRNFPPHVLPDFLTKNITEELAKRLEQNRYILEGIDLQKIIDQQLIAFLAWQLGMNYFGDFVYYETGEEVIVYEVEPIRAISSVIEGHSVKVASISREYGENSFSMKFDRSIDNQEI